MGISVKNYCLGVIGAEVRGEGVTTQRQGAILGNSRSNNVGKHCYEGYQVAHCVRIGWRKAVQSDDGVRKAAGRREACAENSNDHVL